MKSIFENKVLSGIIIIGVIFVSIFVYNKFGKSPEYTNYPSKGTDIIAFGDSLIYGQGASEKNNNFVSLLSQKIGSPIINLGVPGNTTVDAVKRLTELDKYDPKIVVILLGGNDFLRKVDQTTTFSNLEKIIQYAHGKGAVVLLLGIRGGILTDKFEDSFEDLSEKYHTVYVSDVLSGLITNQKYMSDSVHPNDTGYEMIAERVYPVLKEIVE